MKVELSRVEMISDGGVYRGRWYDRSGEEYAHVTEGWLARRLAELLGGDWEVSITSGNGHVTAVAWLR